MTALERSDRGTGTPGFLVRYTRGSESLVVESGRVVLAVPAYSARELLRPFSDSLSGSLSGIVYPPVAEVFCGYPDSALTRPLDGFGFLVPEKEGRSILGTIWSSALFPGRAPAGYVALTTFVGGSRQPPLGRLDEGALTALVTGELRSLMGLRGEPAYVKVSRWERAIPQYAPGHLAIVEQMEALEKNVPGLYLCGNYRGGIAVGDCVMSGEALASRVGRELQESTTTMKVNR